MSLGRLSDLLGVLPIVNGGFASVDSTCATCERRSIDSDHLVCTDDLFSQPPLIQTAHAAETLAARTPPPHGRDRQVSAWRSHAALSVGPHRRRRNFPADARRRRSRPGHCGASVGRRAPRPPASTPRPALRPCLARGPRRPHPLPALCHPLAGVSQPRPTTAAASVTSLGIVRPCVRVEPRLGLAFADVAHLAHHSSPSPPTPAPALDPGPPRRRRGTPSSRSPNWSRRPCLVMRCLALVEAHPPSLTFNHPRLLPSSPSFPRVRPWHRYH